MIMQRKAVKDLSSCLQQLRQCPFSPGKGEKVSDRPDEGGVVAVSVVWRRLTALITAADESDVADEN